MALILGLDSLCASAQQPAEDSDAVSIAREHHPWARFDPGAWRRAQVSERTFDESHQVISQSTTLRVERLTEVGDKQYSLAQQVRIEVGGQTVEAPPKTITYSLSTDEPGTVESIEQGEPETISLEGRDVEARILHVRASGDTYSIVAQLWYSPTEPPYVLRSIVEAIVPTSQETAWRRTRRVLASGLPFLVQEKLAPSSFLEEQQATIKGTRRSIIVLSDRVPGGVAARWTKETNPEGRLIRREIETLLDWGVGPILPEP